MKHIIRHVPKGQDTPSQWSASDGRTSLFGVFHLSGSRRRQFDRFNIVNRRRGRRRERELWLDVQFSERVRVRITVKVIKTST